MLFAAILAYNSAKSNAVVNCAKQQLGKRYVYGTAGPNTFDCSGLAQYCYKKGASYSLPRTADSQMRGGSYTSSKQAGDLIFFNWSGAKSPANHVGILVSSSQMIHAPNSQKPVGYQSLSSYYTQRTITVRRYF